MEIIKTSHYPIFIGNQIVHAAFAKANTHSVLITDENLKRHYANILGDLTKLVLVINPGEQSKTREVKQELEDQLLARNFSRQMQVYALGGGVVTDLAGFLAATYCRGVDFIAIPTSLLAMVDSSIGGKTAVNTPWGKNLIGQFYFPKSVWIDVDFLKTLPATEFSNGMAEVIKHAALFDQNLWTFLLRESSSILEKEPRALMAMIKRNIELKNEVVELDPFEKKERALLNFGHTLGHGIEVASDYRISHGEAVAFGMVLEAYLLNSPIDALIQCLQTYGLLKSGYLGDLNHDLCLEVIRRDKKNQGSDIYMVNWKGVAKADLPIPVAAKDITKALHAIQEIF